jgi:hypothetical protein
MYMLRPCRVQKRVTSTLNGLNFCPGGERRWCEPMSGFYEQPHLGFNRSTGPDPGTVCKKNFAFKRHELERDCTVHAVDKQRDGEESRRKKGNFATNENTEK